MTTRIYQYGGYTYVNFSHVEYSGEMSEVRFWKDHALWK